MMDLINKTVCPPGIEKPNRLALFSVVGNVMSRVRKDAEKAFYAHFPYLADNKKLEEHGKALLIPHLPNDTPEEYRNRVATASFFLMRAGERAYIMDQLEQRFGARFQVIENFLFIHIKVAELADDERVWVLSLLDSLINPNIYLELSESYNFIDKFSFSDVMRFKILRKESDTFESLDDALIVEQHTCNMLDADNVEFNENLSAGMRRHQKYNGVHKYNGAIKYNGMVLTRLE